MKMGTHNLYSNTDRYVLLRIIANKLRVICSLDQLPRLGKRELICLLLFTCNNVVSVWRDILFLCVLGMCYVILL